YYDPIHLQYSAQSVRQDGSRWLRFDAQYVVNAATSGQTAPDGYASGFPESRPEYAIVVIIDLQFHESCRDRKSTRLNSSHVKSSYAVFCLKKKTTMPPLQLAG